MSNDFSKLKRKLLLQVIFTVLIAGLIWIFIQFLFIDGPIDNPVTSFFFSFCTQVLHLDYDLTFNIYQILFRNNRTLILGIFLMVIIVVVLYLALSRITRYFNEVNESMDMLLAESNDDILLSPEMDFMAAKMNTVRKELIGRQRAAREAEQRKNDLVVYLAHDIRTPLTSVIGYLNLLNEAPDMPIEQRANYLHLTLEKAYRLEELIDEFFDITRFNLQTIPLQKEKIHLQFMLQQLADEFYPLLSPQSKQAIVCVDSELCAFADPDKLARVFNNILKNALAYSYQGSAIEIEAHQGENEIIISFHNQGETIPHEKLESIFEKFYRLDSSRSSHTGGAGLGLAIAKEIVMAHRGRIWVESEQEHTTFSVALPAGS